MLKTNIFIILLFLGTDLFAKLPSNIDSIQYDCQMKCDLENDRNCYGLVFAGHLRKDSFGEWSGYHNRFTFRPNNFEYHNSVPCKADYKVNVIIVDDESIKLVFKEAFFKTPQTCDDGSAITEDFNFAIRPFSIYMVEEKGAKEQTTFISLAKVPTTTIWENRADSPTCLLTFN